jgi:hypothetical protein
MTARKVVAPAPYRPAVGAPVRDAATGFVGVFQAVEQLKVGFRPVAVAYIRPFGGGPEVETSPEMLREPTRDEVVSARVAAENRASRERLGGTSEKHGSRRAGG